MKHSEQPVLNPGKFTHTIQRQPEFFAALPQDIRFNELPSSKRKFYLQRAIAASALSLSQEAEEKHGEYDLDANLYRLIGGLSTFHKNQRTIDDLRETFGSPRDMPYAEKELFYATKDAITEFNHTLHEVVYAGASQFDFNELLAFMTDMYKAAGNPETKDAFYHEARTTLIGARNEMAFEQILIAGGVKYQLGDISQDARGGDVIINGIPIDVKASQHQVDIAREKALREGRDPNHIIWSHIHFNDYDGQLTLPNAHEVFARVLPELEAALGPRYSLVA